MVVVEEGEVPAAAVHGGPEDDGAVGRAMEEMVARGAEADRTRDEEHKARESALRVERGIERTAQALVDVATHLLRACTDARVARQESNERGDVVSMAWSIADGHRRDGVGAVARVLQGLAGALPPMGIAEQRLLDARAERRVAAQVYTQALDRLHVVNEAETAARQQRAQHNP
jgi:hypothetical protein